MSAGAREEAQKVGAADRFPPGLVLKRGMRRKMKKRRSRGKRGRRERTR